MEKSVFETEEQMAQALIQLSQADRKGMAPRQMKQVRASPQLIPADAPPQDENEQFKRNLALHDFPKQLRLAADHPSLKPFGWSAGGRGLAISSRADFCKDVLPLLCTGTYASFNKKILGSLNHLEEVPVVVGTYNDLVLCCASRDYQCDYYICNPYTREWIALPPAPTRCHRTVPVGFICDPYYNYNVESSQRRGKTTINVNAEYRCTVLRILPLDQLAYKKYSLKFNVEIFSSETGEWKKSVISSPQAFNLDEINADVSFAYNGMLYWPYYSGKFLIGLDPFMIDDNKSLSSSGDGNMDHWICRLIELDEPAVVDSCAIQCLGVCGRCLRMCDFDSSTHTLLVWELKEEQEQMVVSTAGKLSLKCTRYSLDPNMVSGSLVVDQLAFDPNDEDILYLNIEGEIVMCNIYTKWWSKMERMSTSCGQFFFPLIVLPWWPTPVPRLSQHAHGGGII